MPKYKLKQSFWNPGGNSIQIVSRGTSPEKKGVGSAIPGRKLPTSKRLRLYNCSGRGFLPSSRNGHVSRTPVVAIKANDLCMLIHE